jgi:hypothetical protein
LCQADNPHYFDEGQKDQVYISRDIQKYNKRWPIRHDEIDGDINLQEKTSDREYAASFKLNFYAESVLHTEWTTGQSAMDLAISVVDGEAKISGIKEKMVRKEEGTAKATTALTSGAVMSPSPPTTVLQPSPVAASSIPNVPADQSGPQKLTRVYVKKYGVSALLPTDVFPDAKKLSESDQSFLQGNSWSRQTTLTFSSVREPLAKVYAECATEHSPQAPSKTVQYKVLKPTWFVVSGDLGPQADASLGFYTKGVKKTASS